MTSCGDCNTFEIIGTTQTITLMMPIYNGEDNRISKNINRFNFWSGNYNVHDDGIEAQPLVLNGVDFRCEGNYGMCFAGGQICFDLCFNMGHTDKFIVLMDMSDNNEEVTISGLGDCMDAVYVIRNFSFKTIAPLAYSWSMTLEKVR